MPLLLTTQDQVIRTVEGVADYGGSLDVIIDDARGGERMPAAGVVLLVAVVLIVLALVYYLVVDDRRPAADRRRRSTRRSPRSARSSRRARRSAPVVDTINEHLDAAVDALEGLLVKKAGMEDAVGLVDGLYPGAAAAGFRDFPESREVTPPRISRGLHAGARSRSRGSAARRRSRRRARPAGRCCAT